LGAAGLHLDVDKSEFSVKKTKYLGFIIEAGQGMNMDPEKVSAITAWETPKTVKGIWSFIGFANFYHQFIRNFSEVVAPLTKLTGKGAGFVWGIEQQVAFDKLKSAFTAAPALANFDPDLETVLECDASGWATGGVLSQYGKDKVLHAVGYFSQKHDAAQANYTIHDKELLAVMKCLAQWDAELKMVQKFTVITNHKNLEYFTTRRLVLERHVRWADTLSMYNLTFVYRPGKVNGRADAMSHKEEDIPIGGDDDRTISREFQTLRPVTKQEFTKAEREAGALLCFLAQIAFSHPMRGSLLPARNGGHNAWAVQEEPAGAQDKTTIETPPVVELKAGTPAPAETLEEGDEDTSNRRWAEAIDQDPTYKDAIAALKEGARKFPPNAGIKVSLSECSLSEEGLLMYRDRKWVPNNALLRTNIIAKTHNSPAAGHPGRGNTYSILARTYFWPGMLSNIQQFIQNCKVCGRTKPWRELKWGLLRTLPLPDRIWKKIFMDFITDLPLSDGYRNLMVVTDCLSKDVILIPLPNLKVVTVANAFLERVVAYHWLPDYIVSDRGSQFLSNFWTTLCSKIGIKQRLSTAYHPQTDGLTERMNAVIEA
jgi:hypothetical protein